MTKPTYPSDVKQSQDTSQEPALPGPHVCGNLGTKIMEKIFRQLRKACDHNHGNLTRADLDILIQFLRDDSEIFDTHIHHYNHCVKSCRSFKKVAFTKGLFAKYVLDGTLARQVKASFPEQNHLGGRRWRNVFAHGLLTALIHFVDPRVEDKLFIVYVKLSRVKGRSLTKRDILASIELLTVLIQIFSRAQQKNWEDPHLLPNFCTAINNHIKVAFAELDYRLYYVSPSQLENALNLITHHMRETGRNTQRTSRQVATQLGDRSSTTRTSRQTSRNQERGGKRCYTEQSGAEIPVDHTDKSRTKNKTEHHGGCH